MVPGKQKKFSYSVRFTRTLARQINARAEQEGRHMSSLIGQAVEEYLRRHAQDSSGLTFGPKASTLS